MVQGKMLAEQIPARLDKQTDDARNRAAVEFASKFRQFVNDLVTPEESLEAFAVYRRFDLAQTRGGQSSSIESMKESAAKLCEDLAVHFQTIPKAVITSFVDEHWLDYASKRSILFAARSRGTHVAGVLRPLSKRYLKQWEGELLKREDFQEIQFRADELLEEQIVNLPTFETWAEKVFTLFSEVGVYRSPTSPAVPGTKPNGMISEGSLRTYKQQWFSWTSENALSLIGEQASQSPSPQRITAGPVEVGPSDLAQPVRSEGVRVSLHRVADPSFKIEKYWPSVATLLPELDAWFAIADRVWADASEIVVNLDCLVGQMDLELRFEASNLALAAGKVKAVLSAAK